MIPAVALHTFSLTFACRFLRARRQPSDRLSFLARRVRSPAATCMAGSCKIGFVGGIFLEREAGNFDNAMGARSGGARSPDRGRARRRAVPSGPPSLRFRFERGGRGDRPHLRVRNDLPCGWLLAPRRRKRAASGPFSASRAKLAGGGLPFGYRPHRRERGVVAVACRRASFDFGGLADVDMVKRTRDVIAYD